MALWILDQRGPKLVQKNLPTTPAAVWRVIAPYRDAVVVGAAGRGTWSWLADRWAQEGRGVGVGHAR
jgi:hypothetical protein